MLKRNGVPEKKDLQSIEPSPERLAKGPVVIVECFQEIPCDPCHYSCPTGAIKAFTDINALPEVDHDQCNGCTLCIAGCPGLAVFVVDATYSETEGLVVIPYELRPLPEVDDEVLTYDRNGEHRGRGKVVKVLAGKRQDRTAVLSIAVPKEDIMEVRQIRLGRDSS